MKSPLYLDVRRADSVFLEAETLRIALRGGGSGWYPLRCVSRVVVTGDIEWETRALLACLQAGIPVAFRARDGQLIGHCLSDVSNRVNLESLLNSALQSATGQQRYREWLAQCWHAWRQRFAAASGVSECDAVRDLDRKMLADLEQVLPCSVTLFRDQLAVLIASKLSGVLLSYGFSDNVHVPQTPGVHVYNDLVRLLECELLMAVAYQDGGIEWDEQRGLRYAVVRCFQQYEAEQEHLAQACLNTLWRYLKEDEVD